MAPDVPLVSTRELNHTINRPNLETSLTTPHKSTTKTGGRGSYQDNNTRNINRIQKLQPVTRWPTRLELPTNEDEPSCHERKEPEADQLHCEANFDYVSPPLSTSGVGDISAGENGGSNQLDTKGDDVEGYEDGGDEAGGDPKGAEVAVAFGGYPEDDAAHCHITGCCHAVLFGFV